MSRPVREEKKLSGMLWLLAPRFARGLP